MDKKVSLTYKMFAKVIRKLRECQRVNKALNKQIKDYNKNFTIKEL
jgi:hypothetical protein